MIYSCQEEKAGEISPFSLRGGSSGKVHISEIERVLLAVATLNTLSPQSCCRASRALRTPTLQSETSTKDTYWLMTHREMTVVRYTQISAVKTFTPGTQFLTWRRAFE